MIGWVILAPVLAASLAGRDLLHAGRRWQRDEATLSELLEEVGIAGLVTGIAAATMTHPAIAAAFIALRGGGEIAALAHRVRRAAALRRIEENRKRQLGCNG
jgi:hypothetical protein